jgi:hypothetical protein
MKKLIVIFCLGALLTGASAQGLVNFANNLSSTAAFVEVFPLPSPTFLLGTEGSGLTFYFGLFLGQPNQSWTFTGIYATNTSMGQFSGGVVAVPGWAPGTSQNYFVAGWSGTHDFQPQWLSGNGLPAYFGVTGDNGGPSYGSGIAGNGSSISPLNLFAGGSNTINSTMLLRNSSFVPVSVRSGSVVALACSCEPTYGQTNLPPGLTNAIAVGLGEYFALALKSDGRVAAWGDSSWNPDGETIVPPELTNVVAISAGYSNSLALKADGTVTAWGRNGEGQCNVPLGLRGIVGVSAGGGHSLALRANGTVAAWGTNNFGQIAVPGNLSNVTAVAAGDLHSLALRSDGTVVAWGDNTYGECNVPADLTNAIAVSGGAGYSLALRANGTVVGWGAQTFGVIVPPADLTNAIAISAGQYRSAALKADGTVTVWGEPLPVPLPALSGVTAIAATKNISVAFLALQGAPAGEVSISFISPPSQTISAGSQAFFSVAATGAGPLSYQWYLYGTNAIVSGTNRWLALHPFQSGVYTVVVSNAQGSATSQPVTLNVVPSLNIASVPGIQLIGDIGATYRIDYLPQAAVTGNWTPLVTVTLTNNQQYYCDLSAIGQPARFYRLVQVP